MAKKIVKKAAPKTAKKAVEVGKKSSKPKEAVNETDKVDEYMLKLKHPLKAEIEAVRKIIKESNSKISERVKWNAPSFFYKEDIVTFNGWARDRVHLVFHHPTIVKIKSPLFQGDYPTRRMAYFDSMKEVKENKRELERIMNELIQYQEKK